MMRKLLAGVWNSLSVIGLLLGTLFFAASLTPSLVPRTFVTQGVLSGICFAAGYGTGLLGRWLWTYLELPRAPDRVLRILRWIVVAVGVLVAAVALRRAAQWQNSVHELMGLEPIATAHPVEVSLTAVATVVVLTALVWLLRLAFRLAAGAVRPYVPRRVSNVIGLTFVVILFWSIATGVLFPFVMRGLDSSFAARDALIGPEAAEPTDPRKTGSASSLVRWNELGRTGRELVSSGPSASEIAAFTGHAAAEPIRVYVGLGAAQSARERAALALEELKRVGGFERPVLIVITPTGTGWIDPAAIDTVEYLHHGRVASVALQYSYLSSPLSLIAEPEYGEEAARRLFDAIYGHWTTLPRDRRPKLFLHGLSLGSLNSEKSVELFAIMGDPINGALWSGPTFENRVWRGLLEQRNGNSPAWLPEFRDGSYVRFMNQNGPTIPPDRPWGPMRVVYLQYASDAVSFFDYRDLYREPAWMKGPRGPDVSPQLRWHPVVTMLQIALDMAFATTTPTGYGHVFAPQHYVDPWVAVTDVRGWSEEEIVRLKQYLAAEQRRAIDDPEGSAYDDRGG